MKYILSFILVTFLMPIENHKNQTKHYNVQVMENLFNTGNNFWVPSMKCGSVSREGLPHGNRHSFRIVKDK